jgi:hypothetical protein
MRIGPGNPCGAHPRVARGIRVLAGVQAISTRTPAQLPWTAGAANASGGARWPPIPSGMASLVLLEYPNGRRHATVLDWTVADGAEFELYGRRWRAFGPAVDPQIRNQVREDTPRPMLCKSIGKSDAQAG